MTAPQYRAVEAQAGIVSPTVDRETLDFVAAQRDRAIQQRDDAQAELANMVNLTQEVGRLGDFLRHALEDRDYWREAFYTAVRDAS